jgi:thioester reductase-like protein
VRARFARGRIEWSADHEARVVPVAGDLALPSFGLDPTSWSALESGVDSILHAGAVVNWLLLYGQLRRPNVLGTLEVLRLAARGRAKALHLVSTISVAPADGDESSILPERSALATSPYALSKWIGERHARAAAERGLPLVVYRPAMITGHSTTGDSNPDDFVGRYLAATGQLGVALDLEEERLDMTPVDLVAEGVVRLAARGGLRGRTVHLTNLRRSLSYADLARALVAAGVATRPVSYATFREALEARPSALRPLRSYFPARGFALRMGPWPCPASERLLDEAGVAPRPVDEGLVRRYVEALRRVER